MERRAFRVSGFLMLGVTVVLGLLGLWLASWINEQPDDVAGPAMLTLLVVGGVLLTVVGTGFVILNPNEARVVQFLGRYAGTVNTAGFHWTVPLSTKRRVSLRVRNFESARLKVSDADGNPVEIAAVVVWRVSDTHAAVFAVDDHMEYVAVQAETAVRHLATSYPYEAHDSGRTSLREGDVASEELTVELRERVALAGVEVIESRITHLAYAPEIAQVMLARQQASLSFEATLQARNKLLSAYKDIMSMPV